MRKNNDSGFSMLELLVVGGLLAALALGGAKMMKTQSTAQKTVEKNYEIVTLTENMKGILGVPDNCRLTFSGISPSNGSVTSLKKRVGAQVEEIFHVNSDLPGGLKVRSFRFDRSHPALASNESQLRIEFSRGSNTLRDEMIKFIKLTFMVDNNGVISSCYATTNTDGFWVQSIVDPNDIYYTGGDVGIGTHDPQKKLHVASEGSGDILLEQLDGMADMKRWNLASEGGSATTPSNFALRQLNDAANAGAVPLFVEGATGNVGFGTSTPKAKLDVGGQMKVGGPGVCDASTKGSMAYDSTLDRMVACFGNPLQWRSMSAPVISAPMTVSCNGGGSNVTNTVNLGNHDYCFLTNVQGSNMGKDDHWRFNCDVKATGNSWSLSATCKESNTTCVAMCSN
jgi:hypothetical protein